jgi:transposase
MTRASESATKCFFLPRGYQTRTLGDGKARRHPQPRVPAGEATRRIIAPTLVRLHPGPAPSLGPRRHRFRVSNAPAVDGAELLLVLLTPRDTRVSSGTCRSRLSGGDRSSRSHSPFANGLCKRALQTLRRLQPLIRALLARVFVCLFPLD